MSKSLDDKILRFVNDLPEINALLHKGLMYITDSCVPEQYLQSRIDIANNATEIFQKLQKKKSSG